MADGAYRGNPEVIIPYRKIRACVEHALGRLKTYKILRDYRRAGRTLKTTAAGIAHLHNIALAG